MKRPFIVLVFAVGTMGSLGAQVQQPQEPIEATRFIGYTKRAFLATNSVEDITRGFPRVEFAVRHNIARRWDEGTVLIHVGGIKGKNREPLTFETTEKFNSLNINADAFYTPLPSAFVNAEITDVRIKLLSASYFAAVKPVLARARILDLAKADPEILFDDQYVKIVIHPDVGAGTLRIQLSNQSGGRLGIRSDTIVASLSTDVKGLESPRLMITGTYPEAIDAPSVNTGGDKDFEVKIADLKTCRQDSGALVEVEPDPICRAKGSVLQKYQSVMASDYILGRVIIPMRLEDGSIRSYVFTLIFVYDESAPRKRDPKDVSAADVV